MTRHYLIEIITFSFFVIKKKDGGGKGQDGCQVGSGEILPGHEDIRTDWGRRRILERRNSGTSFSFLFYRLPLPDIINLSCHNNWNPIIREKNEKVKRCHLCGGLDRHVLKRRRRTCLYVVFFPSVIKVGCARVLVTTNSTRRPDTCHTVGSADGLTSSESR